MPLDKRYNDKIIVYIVVNFRDDLGIIFKLRENNVKLMQNKKRGSLKQKSKCKQDMNGKEREKESEEKKEKERKRQIDR